MTMSVQGAVMYALSHVVSMTQRIHTSAIIVIQNSDVSGLLLLWSSMHLASTVRTIRSDRLS